MKIPNEIYPIETFFIKPGFSYYQNLKFVIKQGDLVNKEISYREKTQYNGVFSLISSISEKTVFCNADLIDFGNQGEYEIERQKQNGNYDVEKPESNQIVMPIIFEHEQFTSVLEKQFIKWWEKDVKDKIISKYGQLKDANPICQFARQIRNSFGHSGINVTTNNCADPIWNGLNLKNRNGQNIHSLVSIADFVNFWIEFEQIEL